MAPDPSPFAFDRASALELELRDGDGALWVLRLSPRMEKFVGAYSRLDGFGGAGPLLLFRPAGQPTGR